MQNFINLLKDKTVSQLNELMFDYANRGDLEKVKFLLTSPTLEQHAEISDNKDLVLVEACAGGNLELVKYLLTSPELKVHSNINAQNDLALGIACQFGHLEIVKYLIESPDLHQHSKIPFLNVSAKNPLFISAKYKHLEIFKYLISVAEEKDERLPEYIFKASSEVSSDNDSVLDSIKPLIEVGKNKNNKVLSSILHGLVYGACFSNNLVILKHIFGSQELKKHIDIHQDNDLIFREILLQARLNTGLEVARYFIFDLNIQETENIKKITKSSTYEEIEKMFKIRELNQELKQNLASNNNNKKYTKI